MKKKEFLKFIEEIENEENKYWHEEYPELSKEERVKMWAGNLYRNMREQLESGLNPYEIYTKNMLKDTLEKEPNFIEMLPEIYSIWAEMFDSDKIDRKIKGLIKKKS
jgi:hypothetical protein